MKRILKTSLFAAVALSCGSIFGSITLAGDALAEGSAGAKKMKADTNSAADSITTADASYVLGADIGTNFNQLGYEVDVSAFAKGLEESLQGKELKYTQAELRNMQQKIQKQMMGLREESMKKLQEKNKLAGAENLKKGEEFLAKNAARKEVKTTDSGLQYEVLSEGPGPKPANTSKVKVHYKGTLLDGTEFDSSYSRGQPAVFPLNAVIAGWTEGLQLMPVGSNYKFYIPAKLAYGERGAPGKIGPNEALIFEVKLLEILG